MPFSSYQQEIIKKIEVYVGQLVVFLLGTIKQRPRISPWQCPHLTAETSQFSSTMTGESVNGN